VSRRGPDGIAARSAEEDFVLYCLRQLGSSHSQLFQDLFVCWQLKEKRNGFFVEFGATDGITLSNSKLLEDRFSWSGILAEPARIWHDRLRANRRAKIDVRCVWTESNDVVQFNEVKTAEYSTVAEYSDVDRHSGSRQSGVVYGVTTVSLNDLLAEHNAPAVMDYLSIDTEGSEYPVLSRLDASRYAFRVITVEHNYTAAREKLHELLIGWGYRRQFPEYSFFDDWYVHCDLHPQH
jgi:FkbM family methyltransferase